VEKRQLHDGAMSQPQSCLHAFGIDERPLGRRLAPRRSLPGAPRAAARRAARPAKARVVQPPGCLPTPVRKLEPQPQPLTALGLLTVKPAPISVST
jgi:hypothetical protein